MRGVGVGELAIDLIADEEQVVLAAELADCQHFLFVEELSGRIARIADENSPGPGSQQFLELRDVRNPELVVNACVHCLKRDVVKIGKSLVVGVERLDNYYFVARICGNLHSH